MFIGTSGWRYASWRRDFYPVGLPQRLELEHLAGRLGAVEINGSFYSLQRPESYERWRDAAPPGFRFAVKGGRYITHMVGSDRLQAGLQRFFDSGVQLLGDRLGPILWQFPSRRRFDPEHLELFCSALPRRLGVRLLHHALEPRHPSFDDPAAREILTRHRVALVASDGAGEWPVFADVTSDLVYVRLHGPHELYHGGYSPEQLAAWARLVRDLATRGGPRHPRDAYVFFDNDADGRAPYDAQSLTALLQGAQPDTLNG